LSSPTARGGVPTAPGASNGFLRMPQVLALVPMSRSTLWRNVRDGNFPRPVKLSLRITAWRADDVRGWIDARGLQTGQGKAPG